MKFKREPKSSQKSFKFLKAIANWILKEKFISHFVFIFCINYEEQNKVWFDRVFFSFFSAFRSSCVYPNRKKNNKTRTYFPFVKLKSNRNRNHFGLLFLIVLFVWIAHSTYYGKRTDKINVYNCQSRTAEVQYT